jgi:glucosyl-dolichyl phosphate glucuronosyltransferase
MERILNADGEKAVEPRPLHTALVRMKITVILCTYNRCQSLSNALESVASTVFCDPAEWEVLVVDNNSKDQTREVVADYCHRYPGRFRYLFERRQGKSHALNAGIRASQGDVLAFMDDDVTVEPTWLQNLTAPLVNGEWAGVGGRILPQSTFSAPSWLATEGRYSLAGTLALFDLGNNGCELDRAPFGTNMAFPKKMFERYGGFRTDMGPCPGSEMRNEDTEFGRRLIAQRCRLWYEPSAVVYHAVSTERLTQEYFLAFWFDHGRASVREWGDGPGICGIPRAYLRMLKIGLLGLPKMLRWVLTVDSKRRFYWKGMVWTVAGEIVELFMQSVKNEQTAVNAFI